MIFQSQKINCKKLVVCLLLVGITFQSRCFAQHTFRERFNRTSAPEAAQTRSKNGAIKIELGRREVAVWEAPSSARLSPIILFSHGFLGCNTQSSKLMSEMAKIGFTVFAPNHSDALCIKKENRHIVRPYFGRPDKWTDESFKNRRDDFLEVLHALKQDPNWSKRLDFSNITLVGHSLGGYTVLALGGAWPSWKLPNVKAILALSPYAAPFINNHNLNKVDIPLMLQGGTKDRGITPDTKKSNGTYDQARSPAFYVEFQDATHYAWTDLNKTEADLISKYNLLFLRRYALGDRTAVMDGNSAGVSDYRSK